MDMDMTMDTSTLAEISSHFLTVGEFKNAAVYGSGHINDTYLVVSEKDSGEVIRYILQRVNSNVFKKPELLMENIVRVTGFIKEKIKLRGGDVSREVLQLIHTKEKLQFFLDTNGNYWRMYHFISGASTYDRVKDAEDFYQSGVSFGRFQELLSDFPAETLHETIPDFHNTRKRIEALKEAITNDRLGRSGSVVQEVDFALERADEMCQITDMLKSGQLPLRVTHNDTKLNNIMIDDITREGICVIDLDTVMPGSALFDFGDAIRFGTNKALEDEKDLEKVTCDRTLFETFTQGFLKGCDGSLTPKEIELLPLGAKTMTYETGIRFLTDYLDGDRYFKIHREGHNLDRCRTQFKMISLMEENWEALNLIVQ